MAGAAGAAARLCADRVEREGGVRDHAGAEREGGEVDVSRRDERDARHHEEERDVHLRREDPAVEHVREEAGEERLRRLDDVREGDGAEGGRERRRHVARREQRGDGQQPPHLGASEARRLSHRLPDDAALVVARAAQRQPERQHAHAADRQVERRERPRVRPRVEALLVRQVEDDVERPPQHEVDRDARVAQADRARRRRLRLLCRTKLPREQRRRLARVRLSAAAQSEERSRNLRSRGVPSGKCAHVRQYEEQDEPRLEATLHGDGRSSKRRELVELATHELTRSAFGTRPRAR